MYVEISLVVQWLRIHLAMQGTQVRSLGLLSLWGNSRVSAPRDALKIPCATTKRDTAEINQSVSKEGVYELHSDVCLFSSNIFLDTNKTCAFPVDILSPSEYQ